MSLQCPYCKSRRVASLRIATKYCAGIGPVGSAARGIALIASNTGAIVGPLSMALWALAGVVIGGLAGGVGGSTLGVQMGDRLDCHLLVNNLCPDCGHRLTQHCAA